VIRVHKCGGRMVPQKSTRVVAYFKCDKCGEMAYQRKRLPNIPDTSDIPEADEDWFKNAKLREIL